MLYAWPQENFEGNPLSSVLKVDKLHREAVSYLKRNNILPIAW